jgi:hypothetical protein
MQPRKHQRFHCMQGFLRSGKNSFFREQEYEAGIASRYAGTTAFGSCR